MKELCLELPQGYKEHQGPSNSVLGFRGVAMQGSIRESTRLVANLDLEGPGLVVGWVRGPGSIRLDLDLFREYGIFCLLPADHSGLTV